VDIFLQSNQIVLVGFSIFMRLILGLIGSVFGGGFSAPPAGISTPSSNSPFSRWG
jgi:hypothetical protein